MFFPSYHNVIAILVKVWENSKQLWKYKPYQVFLFFQTSSRVTVTLSKQGKCFAFLKLVLAVIPEQHIHLLRLKINSLNCPFLVLVPSTGKLVSPKTNVTPELRRVDSPSVPYHEVERGKN